MDVFTDARQVLVDTLGPVLPGRVRAYRPDRIAASVAPAIWVGDFTYAPSFSGPANSGVVTFTITVVAAGNERAAAAQLDHTVAVVADACRAAGFVVDAIDPSPVDIDVDTTIPGYDLAVQTTVYVRTFCTTAPAVPVPIPAVPIEVP